MIQRNAILSWKQLGSNTNIILIGEEPGLVEASAEYGIELIPNVERNSQGTPLVSSIFKIARKASTSPFLAYVNADILLFPDIIESTRQVSNQTDKFLIVGQRWDLEVDKYLDYSTDWEKRLRKYLMARGRLHLPAGSDYFIFPRDLFINIPDFAIGRAGWDNWMIFYARQKGWLVIDATPSITIIHQDHDYSHLPEGKPHYTLNESKENEVIAGGSANLYMVLDSQKQLRNGKLTSPKLDPIRILRRGEVLLTPSDGIRHGWRWTIARQFRRLRRRLTGSLN